MTNFQTLPVDEAITWIRAWTDRNWPMTLKEAFVIRDHLGWIPTSNGSSFFKTKLSVDGKEDGDIEREDRGGNGISGVNFRLSSLAPFGEGGKYSSESRAAYKEYVMTLTNLWGPGERVIDGSVVESRWILPNKVAVSVIGGDDLIAVTIESPYITQLDEDLEYYEEKGYGQEGLLD